MGGVQGGLANFKMTFLHIAVWAALKVCNLCAQWLNRVTVNPANDKNVMCVHLEVAVVNKIKWFFSI